MLALFPCLVVKRFVQFLFDIYIHFDTEIGPGLCIVHKGGVRIVSGTKMGADVTIGSQVTIGRSMLGKTDAPVIGSGVYLSIGAQVLGNVTVGDNVVVGANAVVVSDIPANGLAVGVPARFIPKDTSALIP
jgi:serine O-acetyltransferase